MDQDGANELVCLGRDTTYPSPSDWLYVLDARTLAVKWKVAQPTLGTAQAVDAVGSAPGTKVVTTAGYVFDGATGANLWTYGPGFGSMLDVGDVNGDGVGEIVGGVDWTAVRAYSLDLKSPLWDIKVSDINSVRAVNLDGTGPAEIIVGDGQWGNVSIYRYDTVAKAEALVTQVNSQGWGVNDVVVGDLDGDGALELLWPIENGDFSSKEFVVAHWQPALAVLWHGPSEMLDGPFIGARLARVSPTAKALRFVTPSTADS